MRVTNDQIDKLTELCLDAAVRRGQEYSEVLRDALQNEFHVRATCDLSDVKADMTFERFQEAYVKFARRIGYRP